MTKPRREVEVSEGSSVVLHCDVTGNPPPMIFWTKENQQVKYKFSYNPVLVFISNEISSFGMSTPFNLQLVIERCVSYLSKLLTLHRNASVIVNFTFLMTKERKIISKLVWVRDPLSMDVVRWKGSSIGAYLDPLREDPFFDMRADRIVGTR